MFSNSYNMFSIIMWHLCAYILVWALGMTLYGALHIVCQYVYEHLHCIMCSRRLVHENPTSFSFSSIYEIARLVTTKGLEAYYPQYVLIIFMYTGFKSVRYVLSDYVGLWTKVAYLHLVYNLCALHFMNAIR